MRDRIVRIGIPLYKEITAVSGKTGGTLGDSLESMVKGFKKKIDSQKKEIVRKKKSLGEARENADNFEKWLTSVALGKCSKCSEPVYWDLTNEKDIERVGAAVDSKGWYHEKCAK